MFSRSVTKTAEAFEINHHSISVSCSRIIYLLTECSCDSARCTQSISLYFMWPWRAEAEMWLNNEQAICEVPWFIPHLWCVYCSQD